MAATQAQDEPDLHYLLFDPVPATFEFSQDPTDASYSVHELQALPDGNAVDLRAWMSAQRAPALPDPTQLDADIANYNRAIVTLENDHGPFAFGLPQQLMGLAAAYQANGSSDQALALYNRALHIIRVNNGLYSSQQQQVLARMIAVHLARGDMLAASDQQDYLFLLQRRSAGGRVAALLEPMQHYAAWNLFTFNAYATTNPSYENNHNINVDGGAPQNLLDVQLFRAQGLLRAQNLYQHMIDIMKNSAGADINALPPLQMNLALACYLYLSNVPDDFMISEQRPTGTTTMPVNSLCSRSGKEALEERIAVLDQLDSPLEQRIAARFDLADWLLVFRRRSESNDLLNGYYRELSDRKVLSAETAALFNPDLPVAVPSFGVQTYSRAYHNVPPQLSLKYKGYIDIEYTITQYGATRAITVLGSSAATPRAIEDQLLRHLRRSQFRPRLTASGPRNPDVAQVRYYYTY